MAVVPVLERGVGRDLNDQLRLDLDQWRLAALPPVGGDLVRPWMPGPGRFQQAGRGRGGRADPARSAGYVGGVGRAQRTASCEWGCRGLRWGPPVRFPVGATTRVDHHLVEYVTTRRAVGS
jgi:hypothetical protein